MVIVDLLASQIIHFSSNLTMYQFCVFMENLIINLQEMNKEMKLIKKQLHLKLYVQLLIRKHNEIINQARIVNNVFSLHNLLLGISSTTGFIANLYHVCITIDRFDAVVLFTLIVRILFIVYYLGNIQVVVFCCEKFGNQIDLFNDRLCRLTTERAFQGNQEDNDLQFYASQKRNVKFSAAGYFSLGYPLITTDEIFNEQLFQLTVERVLLGNQDDDLWFYVSRKRNVKFTAAGFFNLGYPLITSIISSTITLVAVLVQFTF
ncbi:uncharacterized protein isoform X1 [Rhodnius prolixus]|uniref:uncharacterized protein isoform X1 n=1 Tax=Rhodnius prolixus TaxID=13249 RepID=UPI003D18F5DE